MIFFFEGIEGFLQRNGVKWWGTPVKMADQANGHYFTPTKWSSELIKLHHDNRDYNGKEDPDLQE